MPKTSKIEKCVQELGVLLLQLPEGVYRKNDLRQRIGCDNPSMFRDAIQKATTRYRYTRDITVMSRNIVISERR
jgi:hypothetical protein